MFYAIDSKGYKTFEGKTLKEIKRQASVFFNNKLNVVDEIIVQHEHDLEHHFSMVRVNHIYPNNMIVRGKWN